MALVSWGVMAWAATCRIAVASPTTGFGGRVFMVNAGVWRPSATRRVAVV